MAERVLFLCTTFIDGVLRVLRVENIDPDSALRNLEDFNIPLEFISLQEHEFKMATQQEQYDAAMKLIQEQADASRATIVKFEREAKAAFMLEITNLKHSHAVEVDVINGLHKDRMEAIESKFIKEREEIEAKHVVECKQYQASIDMVVTKLVDLKEEFGKALSGTRVTKEMAGVLCKCDELALKKKIVDGKDRN